MTSTACDLDARGAGGGDAAEAAKGAALSPLPPQAALEALLEPSTAFAPRLALPSAPTCAFLLEGVGTQNGPRYTLRFCRAFDGAHLAKRSERGGWRIGIGPEVIAGEIDMLPTER